MDQNTKQLYLELFVQPLNRNGFIYKVDPEDYNNRDWITLKDKFFNGGYVNSALNNKQIYGLTMKQGPHGHYTDRIILDLDNPTTQYEVAIDVMGKLTDQRDPHLLFQSSKRGGGTLHSYYFLDNYIGGKNVEYIREMFLTASKENNIQRIEVFPATGNGLRLPLSRGGEWLHTTTKQPYTGTKDELIKKIYKKLHSGEIQKINRDQLITRTLPPKNKESSVKGGFETNKGILSNIPDRIKEIERLGIKAGERHEAWKTLVVNNVHAGLTTEQSIKNILDLSFRTHTTSKDIQKAMQTGNVKPLEDEIRRMDSWIRKRYDRTKIKSIYERSSTPEQIEQSYKITEALGFIDQRKPRQKVSEFERVQKAILFIWNLYKAHGWKHEPLVRIPKKALRKAGIYRKNHGFDPLKPLFDYGLIRLELKKGNELPAVYSIHFTLEKTS